MVFAQQVYGYGNENDVLLAITTSGNSGNVLHAVKVAQAKNMKTIGLTGPKGGKLKEAADTCICVPGKLYSGYSGTAPPCVSCTVCNAGREVF